MIKIQENFSLLKYNTFGINAFTEKFIEFDSKDDIHNFLDINKLNDNFFILGGGSNVLFTSDFNGHILYPNIKGINIIHEDDKHVYIEVGCGEVWDNFVEWSVENKLSGIENLSLIPGNIGAVPVQNIGAYGVEIKDYIVEVKVIDLNTNSEISIKADKCNFDYRNSIFKHELKNKVIIYSVIFKLNKVHSYILNYGNVMSELDKFEEVNLKNIRTAIINIRNSKLPNPQEIGNGGSFFKNPIVTAEYAEILKDKYPEMPQYPHLEKVKLAAGWLIDNCGWRGKSYKGAAVHDKQALVLINKNNAEGSDILKLSMQIRDSVFKKFGVELEKEVIVL